MRGFFRFLLFLTSIGLVSAVCVAIYAFDYYSGEGPLTQPKTILFAHGKGFQAMSDELAEQGVIDKPLLFKAMAVALGEARQFKAGEYHFTEKMTPKSIVVMIANGRVVQHKITIPEGLTIREISKLLQSEPALEGDIPSGLADGSLLPETYQFTYGFKRADLIAEMQKSIQTTLTNLWPKRQSNLPFDTPQKALILASVVEKETGLTNERAHVASVFVNRLRKGMKLQSDPTVVYGMEQAMGAPLGRSLTSADLHTETPYNTYTIDGLPPAPICNPGKASIEAVLNPSDTEDLYFVATGHGGHNFASTLEQHNRNVAIYRERMAK